MPPAWELGERRPVRKGRVADCFDADGCARAGLTAVQLASLHAMRVFSVVFLIGVCLVQTRAAVDGLAMGAMLLGAGALLVVLALRWAWPRTRQSEALVRGALLVVIAAATGAAWSAWRAELRLADALRGELEGVDLVVRGHVASLPQAVDQGWRFVLETDGETAGVPRRLLLSWRQERDAPPSTGPLPAPQPGEAWSFVVRLRRPHGFVNPGGFDYEAWLLERGIRATGYVRKDATRRDGPPATAMQAVHRLRALLRDRMLAVLPGDGQGGLLVALAVGDQGGISASTWEVFRRTGVGHLVSISGLHVALVGLFCGAAVSLLWRRLPGFALRLPAQKAAAAAALGGATVYALLAGLGIPVLRAWLMLVVAAAVLFSGRAVAPSRTLAVALLVVLVIDPWAVLAAGFWLSFGAVAIILATLGGRVRARSGWRAAVRVQLAISVALIPLLLAQFQSFPLLSPVANLVAIPIVSFVITPLVLLSLPWPSAWLLLPADTAASLMMVVLERLAAVDGALWEQAAPPPWLLGAGLAAVAVLLLPRATPGRLAAPALLAGLLAWQPARPPEGGFQAQVLDVGQGLAVHVQTRRHDLMFDAGPPYGSEADAGSRVILPYLRAAGVERLDALVLSHDDADHTGGAASLVAGTVVTSILAGQPVATASRLGRAGTASGEDPGDDHGVRTSDETGAPAPRHCATGGAWEWDGVRFEMLHPQDEASAGDAALAGADAEQAGRGHDNETSCVLRVSAAAGALLLTGDIGVATERALLARLPAGALESTVVVSAHHGSRSSSSAAFIDATRALHVVHSAGYRNAFGHPHPQVWARWADAGARNWRTDVQGAIGLVFPAAAEGEVSLSAARERAPRYWHGR